MIKLGDTSLIVSYIQIKLKESLCSTAQILVKHLNQEEAENVVLVPNGTVVSGVYNKDTYKALAVYVYSLYPNEGFPYYYEEHEEGLEVAEDIKIVDEESLNPSEKTLEEIIKHNIELSDKYPEVLNIPDRVIMYFLNSVISNSSSDDDILEIESFIYGSISNIPRDVLFGDYSKIEPIVKEKQKKINERFGTGTVKETGYFDVITEAYWDKV